EACQLLNKSRSFKNASASLETLAACIGQCRNRASARLRLYRWLMFNVLIHLKNISFMVSAEGIELSPPYDMLCTAVLITPYPRCRYAIDSEGMPATPTRYLRSPRRLRRNRA